MGVTRVRIVPENHEDPLDAFLLRRRANQAYQLDEESGPRVRAAVVSPYGRKLCEASEALLDSISAENYKDLQWYFEQHPVHDTFASLRAKSIGRKLQAHGKALLADFFPNEVFSEKHKADHLLLQVHDARIEDSARQIHLCHQFYWELLEDVKLWGEVFAFEPASVHVVRVHNHNRVEVPKLQLQPRTALEDDRNVRHVLAITARPLGAEDIPYRLITRTIASVVRNISDDSFDKVTLEIVRPGTFDALVQSLDGHDPEYFDVLHLDLHGFVRDGEGYLQFVCFDPNWTIRPHPISASRLANLVAQYRIGTVVINACRSAAGSETASNTARLLVQAGVRVAIGMSFNVLSSTAEKFIARFYELFLRQKFSAIHAAQCARHLLREFPTRTTQFETTIQLQDCIIPILHCSSTAISDTSELGLEMATELGRLEEESLSVSTLAGREGELLSLESYMTHDIKINVQLLGEPGVGKTAMLKHTASWWQETGLYRRVLYLDFEDSDLESLTMDKLTGRIAKLVGITAQNPSTNSVISALNKDPALLLMDHMDRIDWLPGSGRNVQEKRLRLFVHKLQRCSTLFASRSAMDWLGSIVQLKLPLTPLTLSASVALSLSTIRLAVGITPKLISQDDIWNFEQYVTLSNGIPWAIENLSRDLALRLKDGHFVSMAEHLIALLQLVPIEISAESRHWHTSSFLEGDVAINAFKNKYCKSLGLPKAQSQEYLPIDAERLLFSAFEARESASASQSDNISLHSSTSGDSNAAAVGDWDMNQVIECHIPPDYDLDYLICLSFMAFWRRLPSDFEPFITAVVSIDLARRHLDNAYFACFRDELFGLLEPSQVANESLHETLTKSWPSKRWRLKAFAEFCSSLSCLAGRRARVILEEELHDYVTGPTLQQFGSGGTHFAVLYYSISPILTIFAQSSARRQMCPPGFTETLAMARAALYHYSALRWVDHQAVSPLQPGFDGLAMELEHDFFNHLSRAISCQKIASWPPPGKLLFQGTIGEAARLETSRSSIITYVLETFSRTALAYVKQVRQKYFHEKKGKYKPPIDGAEDWNKACILEIACTATLLKLVPLYEMSFRSLSPLIDDWSYLATAPMFARNKNLPKNMRDVIKASHMSNSIHFRLIHDPSAMALGLDEWADSRERMERVLAKFLSIPPIPLEEEAAYDPAKDPFSEFIKIGIGGKWNKDQLIRKMYAINIKASQSTTREVKLECTQELEHILNAETAGANSVFARTLIYKMLSSLHRNIGNDALAVQYRAKHDELRSILEPATLSELERKERFLRDYRIQRAQADGLTKTESFNQVWERQLMQEQSTLKSLENEIPPNIEAIMDSVAIISNRLVKLKRHEEAVPLYRREIAGRREYLRLDHPKILSAMFALGNSLSEVQRLEEAIPLWRVVHQAYQGTMDRADPKLLGVAGSLGLGLFDLVRTGKAEVNVKQREELMGEARKLLIDTVAGHQERAERTGIPNSGGKNNLAALYEHEGAYKEAEKLYREIIATNMGMSEDLYDVSTLLAQHNLACLLAKHTRRLDEAMLLHRTVFNRRIERFGPRHPDTIFAMQQLHYRLQFASRIEDAQTLFQEFIAAFEVSANEEKNRGEQTDFDANVANYELAKTLQSYKMETEAVKLLEQLCLEWRKDANMRRYLVDVLRRLSLIYSNRTPPLLTSALVARLEELDLRTAMDGRQHSDTLETLDLSVVRFRKVGLLYEAERNLKELIEAKTKIGGEENIIDQLIYLADIHEEQEKWKDAEAVLLRAHRFLNDSNPGSNRVGRLASSLGKVYAALKEWPNAETYRRLALQIWERNRGANGADALTEILCLAEIVQSQGRHEESKLLFQSLVDTREELQDADNANLFCAKVALSASLRVEGDLDGAEESLRRTLRQWEEARQNNIVESIIYSQLAFVYEKRQQYDRAIHFRQASLLARKKLEGRQLFPVTVLLKRLADTCEMAKRWDEVEDSLREMLQLLNDDVPNITMQVAKCMRSLSTCLVEQGTDEKLKESETLAKEAAEMMGVLRGESDELVDEYWSWHKTILEKTEQSLGGRGESDGKEKETNKEEELNETLT